MRLFDKLYNHPICEYLTSSRWWGKLLGAFMGFIVAGPIGALFGIFLGNYFDRGLAIHFGSPYLTYFKIKNPQTKNGFIDACFAVMGHLAKVNGHVSQSEINWAYDLMLQLKLSNHKRNDAKLRFKEGKEKSFALEKTVFELKRAAYPNTELLQLFVDIQYQFCRVTGWSPKKLQQMNIILTALDLAPLHKQHRFYEDANFYHKQSNHSQSSSSQYQTHQKNATSDLAQAYTLLQVNSHSTHSVVKKAYRKLISKHHPDRLIAMNASEIDIKKANEKTGQIRQAYRMICQHKGWRT